MESVVGSYGSRSQGEMAKTEELLCDGNLHFELYAATYFHPKPRGLIVLAHSLQDNTGSYEQLVRVLWNARFSVYLYNWRHQGKSPTDKPPLVYVANSQELLEDLKLTIEQARSRESNCKVFIMGHDLGATVAALYASSIPCEDVAGMVLFSPAMIPPIAKYRAGKCSPILSVLWPKWKLTVERKGTLDEMYVRTFRSCARLIQKIGSEAKNLRIPLLVIYGNQDSTEEIESSKLIYVKAVSEDKQLMTFEGRSDELWSDNSVSSSTSSIIANWLEEKTDS